MVAVLGGRVSPNPEHHLIRDKDSRIPIISRFAQVYPARNYSYMQG